MKVLPFLAALLLPISAFAGETRPIVVELFTSQGCSSCPPADRLLGELAQRRDVIALGFHITYWDNLGWKDPLSSPQATERQRAYAERFDRGQAYTPQIVVDGARDLVGSDREAVFEALRAAPKAAAPVHFAADPREATIGPGRGRGTVLIVRFLRHRTTPVGAGENARRTAEDTNGVETIATAGEWDGTPRRVPIAPPAADEGVAVLVQAPDGTILGAGAI
jgi:hypothetical protein